MNRFPPLAVPLVAVLALGTAACGASGAPTVDGATAASAATAGTGAVTVEHHYGSTEVPAAPQRIVSLGAQWTDVLLALHAPLVGYAADPNVDGGVYPWQAGRLDGVTPIQASDGVPYEQVAALDPDLVVVTFAVQDAGEYERLSAIAPTIPLLGDRQVDRWQDLAAVAGEVLGRPGEAAALVAEVDAAIDTVAADVPGLDGRTYALANYVPGDSLYVVADETDGSHEVFGRLGLSIDPGVVEVADGVSGRAKLSLEQVAILDADVLVLFTNGADTADIQGYAALPAVRADAVAVLGYADVVGLNTPTPLSVPHSLALIRPALEAAAGAT
jgi:iron complex transport system substrate-binding protein